MSSLLLIFLILSKINETFQWKEINPSIIPPAREHHSAIVYTSSVSLNSEIMIIFGGILADNSLDNTIWFYYLNTGTWVEKNNIVTAKPSKRYGHSSSYIHNINSQKKVMYIFGGLSNDCKYFCDDIWKYEISTGNTEYKLLS